MDHDGAGRTLSEEAETAVAARPARMILEHIMDGNVK
jgi:hypothetical protein